MATADQIPVLSYHESDYLDIGVTDTPNVVFCEFFTQFDESPNMATQDRHYVPHKNSTTMSTAFQTQFPFNVDEYMKDPASQAIRDVGELQQLDKIWTLYKCRLTEPVDGETNTYFCRKFVVSPQIDSITRTPGEIKTISGNLNAVGDVAVGSYNTQTKTFTEAPAA